MRLYPKLAVLSCPPARTLQGRAERARGGDPVAKPNFHVAELRPGDVAAIEELENRLGLTLIAWASDDGRSRQRREPAPPEAHLLGDPSEPLI